MFKGVKVYITWTSLKTFYSGDTVFHVIKCMHLFPHYLNRVKIESSHSDFDQL